MTARVIRFSKDKNAFHVDYLASSAGFRTESYRYKMKMKRIKTDMRKIFLNNI